MNEQIALKDAGIREKDYARDLAESDMFPADITYEELLTHAKYDCHTDEIILTVENQTDVRYPFRVAFFFKVNRP